MWMASAAKLIEQLCGPRVWWTSKSPPLPPRMPPWLASLERMGETFSLEVLAAALEASQATALGNRSALWLGIPPRGSGERQSSGRGSLPRSRPWGTGPRLSNQKRHQAVLRIGVKSPNPCANGSPPPPPTSPCWPELGAEGIPLAAALGDGAAGGNGQPLKRQTCAHWHLPQASAAARPRSYRGGGGRKVSKLGEYKRTS